MLTWETLREHILSSQTVAAHETDWLVVTPRGPGGAPGPQVIVRRSEAQGRPVALLLADVCPARACNPRRALLAGRDLAVGGLMAVKDVLVIRHLIPLAWAQVEEIDEAIEAVSREAAAVRALVVVPSRPPGVGVAVFSGYAE